MFEAASLIFSPSDLSRIISVACRWAVGWLYRRFDMTVAINPDLLDELAQIGFPQAADHILKTLAHTDWNKSQAAGILQIERSTLDRKIKTYDLKR